MPVNNGGEDLSHSVVIKRVNGYDIHVSSESIRDIITTSTRGTHGRNEELNETWKKETRIHVTQNSLFIWSGTKVEENSDLRMMQLNFAAEQLEDWPELDQNIHTPAIETSRQAKWISLAK